MTTTWTIAIDWDRDGSFDGQYDDVTNSAISADWFLGERTPYQDTADNSTLTSRAEQQRQTFFTGVLLEFPWKPLYAGLSYNVTVSTE